MDTSKIIKVFSLFDEDIDYESSSTFQKELNRQCGFMVVPTSIVAVLSWLPYISLDQRLFPHIPQILFFRLGFSLVGLLSLFLHYTPYFKKRSYLLIFFIICYLELATGAILGLVAADSAYMGGYAMLVMVLPMMPFKKVHSLLLLAASLLLFVIIGIGSNMTFQLGTNLYGLYNLVGASAVSIIAIFVLDNFRKVNFEKNQLIYITNMKLKVATMEIFQINEELKKANRLKSKLLEIAAHDLKNPLQVIVAHTDLLKARLKDTGSPRTVEQLNIIYKSTDSMIVLITKLLKALTLDSGKLVLNRSKVDVGKLLKSVIDDNRPQLDKKGQKLVFSAQEGCIVDGDEMLIKEIFENLLSNAVKFSYPGKSIWVDVYRDDTTVTYKVRDEGPGISEADKEKMFARFQKLSARPTGGEPSTGLGLAITRDLVELHKGKIWLESELGRGCTFFVQLPINPPHP